MNGAGFPVIPFSFFVLALLHTFSSFPIKRWASSIRQKTLRQFCLLLAHPELAFPIWAALLSCLLFFVSRSLFLDEIAQVSVHEPIFVFAMTLLASSQALISGVQKLFLSIVSAIPFSHSKPGAKKLSFYALSLGFVPLLGSGLTEPAALTIALCLLRESCFSKERSRSFKYGTLAVLFVNTSVGGVLTPFAAPPILLVAKKWGWDLSFTFQHFAPWALLTCFSNALFATYHFKNEIRHLELPKKTRESPTLFYLFLGLLFACAGFEVTHSVYQLPGIVLMASIGILLGKHYKSPLRLKEAFAVFLFLLGLGVLVQFQKPWVEPLLQGLSPLSLFLGSALLTSVLDNAALTQLGSLVPDLTFALKYALVAGAICGGGLTIIANAPNPAAVSLLEKEFSPTGISPKDLLKAALLPTLIALVYFGFGLVFG